MADTALITSDINVTDASDGSALSTGDLRRSYNFGKEISTLDVPRAPLFSLVSKVKKKTVPDSSFKITEERPFFHKRYAFVCGWKTWTGSGNVPVTGYTANNSDIASLTPETVGSYMALKMGTDYKSEGNFQNVFGQVTNKIAIGDSGTRPIFFLRNQTIKIPTKGTATGTAANDYILCKVLDVQTSGNYVFIGVKVTRPLKTSTNSHLTSFTAASTLISDTYTYGNAVQMSSLAVLESMKTYVQGNTYAEATGYPEWYNTQPYSTRYGLTQITKHAFSMSGSAVVTKYLIEQDEYGRRMSEVALDHIDDISKDMYFSQRYTEDDGTRHTQGIADWAINYGHIFPMTYASDTQDTFLDQMSVMYDPRRLRFQKLLFVVPMLTNNWLHKLGGYALNNMKLGITQGSTTPAAHYTYDFAKTGERVVDGATIFTFGTLYGPMNVLYDPTLDGTEVKMLAINTSAINYCILNGRDTQTYVLDANSNGIDAKVTWMMTEWGMELTKPETFAIWT